MLRIPKKKNFRLKPILPLVPIPSKTPGEDKSKFIAIDLRTRAGGGEPTSGTYKKFVPLFEEGDPQAWIDFLKNLEEIWVQNSVSGPSDRKSTVRAILKGESLDAYDSALAERLSDGHAMTTEDTDEALKVVAKTIFPHRALESQKMWMNRMMRKPSELSTRKMASAITRINNDLPRFPAATEASKFSDLEVVSLLEWSLPDHWRAKFDYDGYIPTEGNKTKLIAACEAIERNEADAKPDATPANNKKENTKKGKFASKQQKRDENEAGEARSYYCRRCGKNPHHNTAQCKKIQADNRANNKFSSSHPPNKRSFSNKGFSKEVNMLARGPARAKTLKKMERAIKAEIALDKKRKLSSDSENESEHELQLIESLKTSK